MSSILTFNQVVEILKDIAQRHYQINTFFLGKDWELENNQDIQYPLLQVYPEAASMPQTNGEYKTINIRLNCKVVDYVNQDQSNQKDVHSDTLQIAQDIINELNQHPYYIRSNASIIGDINLANLEEFEDDYTAGWEFAIQLRLINNNSYCGLPFEEIPGYSASGPASSGFSFSTQYLTCDTVTACTSFQDYVQNAINTVSADTNTYTISAQLVGTTAFFDRNDQLSAYTLQLSGLTSGITATGNYLPLSGGTLSGSLYTTDVYPSSSSTYNLGDASARWNNFYGKNLNIQNSGGYEIYFNGGGDANIYQSELSNNLFINTNSGNIYMGNSDGSSTFGIIGNQLYSGNTPLSTVIFNTYNIGSYILGRDVTQVNLATSATAESIMYSFYVPPGFIQTGDIIDVYALYTLIQSSANNKDFRIRFSSNGNIAGSSAIGFYRTTTNNQSLGYNRIIAVRNDTTIITMGQNGNGFPTSYGNSIVNTNATVTVPSMSAGFYILLTAQKPSGETARGEFALIKLHR